MPQETITINQSFVEIKSPNIPPGDTRVTIHNPADMGVIHDQVIDQSNGEISIQIDSIPNRKALALMMDPAEQPTWLEAATVSTIGDIELFANETLRIWPGWKDIDRWLTINGSNTRFTTHDLYGGATASLNDKGLWTIRPNNAFNHLDPGESEILNIPYTQVSDTASDDIWGFVTASFSDKTWSYRAEDDTYKKFNTSRFDNITFYVPDIAVGATYLLQAVITERTGGDLTLRWGDENGNIIGSFAPFGFNGNTIGLDRESYPAPPNAGSIVMIPGTPWNGRMNLKLFKVIEAELYNAEVIVKGSEQVGPKLIQRESFLGWPKVDDEITYQSQSGPLYAPHSFTEGKLYEIDVTTSEVQQGTIKPHLVGDFTVTESRYTCSGDERNVFYLRAPANCESLRFEPDGFIGKVSNIIVKELICTGVDLPRGYEIENPASGKLKFWPLVAPKNGRISESQEAQHYYNWRDGHQSSEFGVRQEAQESTLVENATYTKRRSAISLKGGPWCEVWNVKIIGGYNGNADKYQTGFQSGDNKPWMEASYIYNMQVDLKLPSMRGAYDNQNSDCILFNSNHSLESRRATGYLMNIDARNASDGVIDNKCIIFARNISLYGGWRTERGHTISQSFLCASKLDEEPESQCAIHAANYNETHTLWMSEVNGQYIKSPDDLRDMVKDSGFTALEGDVDVSETKRACVVAKTMPRLPEKCNLQMSDYRIEISPAGLNNWSILHKSEIFEPGTLLKVFDVSPGTYDLRVKYFNGQHESVWDSPPDLRGITIT